MNVNYTIIGKNISKVRKRRRLSQETLAEYVDVSSSFISQIELGKKQASLGILIRVSNVLGVTVDYLLNGNQTSDDSTAAGEYSQLLSDCSLYERQVITEVATALKTSLRQNYSCIDHNNTF